MLARTGGSMRRLGSQAVLAGLLLLPFASAAAPQEPVAPPPLSAEQELRLSALPPDTQLFERFRPNRFPVRPVAGGPPVCDEGMNSR